MSSWFSFTPDLVDSLYGAGAVFGFFYLQIVIPYFLYSIKVKKWDLFKSILILPFWFLIQIVSPHKWFVIEKDDDNNTPEGLTEWIGFGDLRLGVMIGLILGLKFAIVALFISYIIGALIGIIVVFIQKKNKGIIPFGPFLVVGAFITLFYGQAILNTYFQFGELIRNAIL